MKQINKNCKIELKMKEAEFLSAGSFFDKQDPFLQFNYGGRVYKTQVHDDAGKHAIFNETFVLEDVSEYLKKNLVIEAYDEDTLTNKFIGEAKGIKIDTLIKDGVQEFNEVVNDKKGKKTGSITFSVKYIWEEPDPPLINRDAKLKPLTKKCKLIVNIIDATFLKNADTFGD